MFKKLYMQEHKALKILLEHRTFGLILQDDLKNTESAKIPKTEEHWKSYPKFTGSYKKKVYC